MVVINAKFDGKNFVPDELPKGLALDTRVTIVVPSPNSPGSLDAIVGIAKNLDLPSDFAAQHEHYTKGTPKR